MPADNKSKPLTIDALASSSDTFSCVVRFLDPKDTQQTGLLSRSLYHQYKALKLDYLQLLHLDDVQLLIEELRNLPVHDPLFTLPEEHEPPLVSLMKLCCLGEIPTETDIFSAAATQRINLIYQQLYGPLDNYSTFSRFQWLRNSFSTQQLVSAVNAINAANNTFKFKILLKALGLSTIDPTQQPFDSPAHERLIFLHKILNGEAPLIGASDATIFENLKSCSVEKLVLAEKQFLKLQLLAKIARLEDKLEEKSVAIAANEQLKLFCNLVRCIKIPDTHSYEERLQWFINNHDEPDFSDILTPVLISNKLATS